MTYQKRNKQNSETLLGLVLGAFFKGLWLFVSLPFKKEKKRVRFESIDRETLKDKWIQIEHMAKLGGESNLKTSIFEADKLLDTALQDLGLPGETMGERLKSAREFFTLEGYNAAWDAHKVRNMLAHESSFDLLHHRATQTIENFRRALMDLRIV